MYHVYTSLFYPLLLKAVLAVYIKQRRIKVKRSNIMSEKREKLAERQELLKVEGFSKLGMNIREFMRGGYLNSFKIPFSIWEEHLMVLNDQVKQWQNFQQDYIRAVIEFYDRFPSPNKDSKDMKSNFEHFVDFQKEYVELITSLSEKFTKETLEGIQRNVDIASSLLKKYINQYK